MVKIRPDQTAWLEEMRKKGHTLSELIRQGIDLLVVQASTLHDNIRGGSRHSL